MKYQVGQRVTGVINNITDLGIFLTLPGRRSGLVHHDDFGENWLRERHNFRNGQEIRVVVIHNFKGKLALSLKRVNDPLLIDPLNQFSKTKTTDFEQVMNKTLKDAKKEITYLKKELADETSY
ncbi:S1 RNA-binding domain-containing protein [Lactobacillus sp. ESL0791]|uniref:S1 RNA-binding domain-containing protein n=1 Tax=Lactobacillus sp. ESL0791 TaxID=2983234 RepID=UPI0023F6CA26|nr:S1 RNA-binding domain-containing protein [Lactobacillus sp. ESL0791]MDF7639477.1 S1 RNA-binding domain-containing protein [Lactobacillus sp. ESL0791]